MLQNLYHSNAYENIFYGRLVKIPLFNCMASDKYHPCVNSILKHAPLTLFACFLFIATFCFGPGYQPISFFFLPGILFLVGYTRSVPSLWMVPAMVFPSVAIGIFFGYAGSFSYSGPWDAHDTVYMIPTAMMFSFLICIALVIDRAIANFSLMMLHFIEVFFAFPMVWAGLWTLIAKLSPFGDFGNWGFAIALMGLDEITLGLTWLFGAIPGGAFAFGMMVSSILYLSRRFLEVYYPDVPPEQEDDATVGCGGVENEASVSREQLMSDHTHLRVFFLHPIAFVVYISAVVYSFGSIYSTFGPEANMFYQAPISSWAPKTVQMSCLVNADLNATEQHLQFGGIDSKFVLWSEQSVTITDEKAFLASALKVSEKYKAYLGLAYKLIINQTAEVPSKFTTRNMFSMIVPPAGANKTANVGFTYQKAHTVPGVEGDVEPGKGYVPFVDTPYGRIGAAIGYDFDFPSVEEAYTNRVSIMMQPTWNWGATGPLHASMNRLRAVENGFILFRCASNGISGVFDQFYNILSQQITLGATDGFVHKLPIRANRWTLYSVMPDYLGIVCMAVFAFWVMFLSVFKLIQIHRYFNPRVIKEPSQTI